MVLYMYARLYLESREFWRAVFAIGTLFTIGNANSWDDILPCFTQDCLDSLEKCHSLMEQFLRGTNGYNDLKVCDITTFNSLSHKVHIVPTATALDVVSTMDGIGGSVNQALEQGQPSGEFDLEKDIKNHIVAIYNEAVMHLADEGMQIVCTNQIRIMCTYLLRLANVAITNSNVEMVLGDVLGEAGIM